MLFPIPTELDTTSYSHGIPVGLTGPKGIPDIENMLSNDDLLSHFS